MRFSGTPIKQMKNGRQELCIARTGNDTGRLSQNEIAKIEDDYLDIEMDCYVFELGAFSGLPFLPEGIPAWQEHGFDFRTSLAHPSHGLKNASDFPPVFRLGCPPARFARRKRVR